MVCFIFLYGVFAVSTVSFYIPQGDTSWLGSGSQGTSFRFVFILFYFGFIEPLMAYKSVLSITFPFESIVPVYNSFLGFRSSCLHDRCISVLPMGPERYRSVISTPTLSSVSLSVWWYHPPPNTPPKTTLKYLWNFSLVSSAEVTLDVIGVSQSGFPGVVNVVSTTQLLWSKSNLVVENPFPLEKVFFSSFLLLRVCDVGL